MRAISLCAFVFIATGFAQSTDHPKITGIDHVDFYTTAPEATRDFYTQALGLSATGPIEPGQIQRYVVGTQWVGYSPTPNPNSPNRMDHIAFRTDNCAALRDYIAQHGILVPNALTQWKDGSVSFTIKDPEGHKVEFIQVHGRIEISIRDLPVSRHMIHVGFVVHDRAAEDHFYKDILGFHIYWHGGMTADRDDWVAMQVPDGTDWLEYMLNIKPNADLRTTGVMNHISLGVKDMKQAATKVDAAIAQLPSGSKPRKDDKPKIGRDGKWQYNIYDPDQTRIELMEFTPAEKPCCSEFTGPHPKE
ncbi:MAG TPA: VOC family protein [Terriglobales bacterium]|nr:VOC family protein [Terriglobales bacterium]